MMHSQHLTDRWRDRRRRSAQDERGLALLDVLIGIAIFALIAIIAVTAISQYRARAYEAGAVSDARTVSIAIEAAFVDGYEYPADEAAVEALLADDDAPIVLTSYNEIGTYTAQAESFTLCIENEDGEIWAEWASVDSTMTKGRSGGCP